MTESERSLYRRDREVKVAELKRLYDLRPVAYEQMRSKRLRIVALQDELGHATAALRKIIFNREQLEKTYFEQLAIVERTPEINA